MKGKTMPLKILKVNFMVTLKADPDDQDDLRDKLYEYLQVEMEDESLDFEILEEENDESELEE